MLFLNNGVVLRNIKNRGGAVPSYSTDMPEIHDAEETLKDIYNRTTHSPVMKWITKNAEFSN